jgi:hypothetical protein
VIAMLLDLVGHPAGIEELTPSTRAPEKRLRRRPCNCDTRAAPSSRTAKSLLTESSWRGRIPPPAAGFPPHRRSEGLGSETRGR